MAKKVITESDMRTILARVASRTSVTSVETMAKNAQKAADNAQKAADNAQKAADNANATAGGLASSVDSAVASVGELKRIVVLTAGEYSTLSTKDSSTIYFVK